MEKLIENKKVRLNYEALEMFEAGIELKGFEVKAVRSKMGKLVGAHITVRGGEAYLINAHIPPYQVANTPEDYDPYRQRRLLLSKKEIDTLGTLEAKKGLTIIPFSMYSKNGKIKVEIGVVRGKKSYDKREKIKESDTLRDMEREVKRVLR